MQHDRCHRRGSAPLAAALLLLVFGPVDHDTLLVAAARRRHQKQQQVAGRRDSQSCAVGSRGWQVAPPSRFEEGAPPCQLDQLSMDEAGAVFVERYEGQRPLIVTGATANLPQDAFTRCEPRACPARRLLSSRALSLFLSRARPSPPSHAVILTEPSSSRRTAAGQLRWASPHPFRRSPAQATR
jgi:hypothetical protein